MGCVESATESPAKRQPQTSITRGTHNGPSAKISQKRPGSQQLRVPAKKVEIGTQTDEGGGALLRRLSSKVRQKHRASTRIQRSTEPPDHTFLFDLDRTTALTRSGLSQYIDQALAVPGKQDTIRSETMRPNGSLKSAKEGPVSAREKQLIQGCWKEVQTDLAEFGVDMFVRLLEQNPQVKNLFPFGKLNLPPDKLRHNSDLRAHGQRVMETIGAAVEGLDDWELIATILEDLGARHALYGAKPEHFSAVGEAFMYSLRIGLPPKVFTSEVQEAWENIFKVVAVTMSDTMRSDENHNEKIDESNQGAISSGDKRLVQGCWKVIQKDLINLGATLFVRLLEKNPSIKNLFPFGKLNLPPEKLKRNKDLRAHGQRVMETIGAAVEGLDDPGLVVTVLEDLGARHKVYGAKPEHFPPLEEAFMYTLKSSLPPKVFTSEVQQAWGNVFNVVATKMSGPMSDEKSGEGPISAKDVRLVQGCWKVVQQDLVNLGAVLFVRLLEKNPSIKDLFPFGKLSLPPQMLKHNSDLRAHGQRVMETIGTAVGGLNDLGKIVPILKDLGARHRIYGAKPEHFQAVMEAFMYSLKNGLPPKVFTSEVQEAWGNIMKVVGETMNSTMG